MSRSRDSYLNKIKYICYNFKWFWYWCLVITRFWINTTSHSEKIFRLHYHIYLNNLEANDITPLTNKEGSMNPCIMTLQRMWVSLCTQKQKEVSLFGFPKHEQQSSVHTYKTWKKVYTQNQMFEIPRTVKSVLFMRTIFVPFPEKNRKCKSEFSVKWNKFGNYKNVVNHQFLWSVFVSLTYPLIVEILIVINTGSEVIIKKDIFNNSK